MKDYSVSVRVKNNFLLTIMKDRGYEGAMQLSRESGVPAKQIGICSILNPQLIMG